MSSPSEELVFSGLHTRLHPNHIHANNMIVTIIITIIIQSSSSSSSSSSSWSSPSLFCRHILGITSIIGSQVESSPNSPIRWHLDSTPPISGPLKSHHGWSIRAPNEAKGKSFNIPNSRMPTHSKRILSYWLLVVTDILGQPETEHLDTIGYLLLPDTSTPVLLVTHPSWQKMVLFFQVAMGSKDTAAQPYVKAEVAPVLNQSNDSSGGVHLQVDPKGGWNPRVVRKRRFGKLGKLRKLGSGSMMFVWRICCNSRLSLFSMLKPTLSLCIFHHETRVDKEIGDKSLTLNIIKHNYMKHTHHSDLLSIL